MKLPLVKHVANSIIREIRKWDGVRNYGDMNAAAYVFARPLAKRLIKIINKRRLP